MLALDERPSRADEPFVCLNERPVPLNAEARAPRPARPGHAAKRDTECRRGGTAGVFGVLERRAGRQFRGVTPQRSAIARISRTVATAYAAARIIHLVPNNCVFR